MLIINAYLFTLGQVWILFAEFFYLKRAWPNLNKALVFKWTFFANLASTALGAILIPFLWAAIFGLLASIPGVEETDIGNIFWATGTWILGDNSPYGKLAMVVSGILFVATYFVTVLVEYRVFKRFVVPITLKQCYIFNLISYSGLVILFVAGMLWG